MQFRITLFALVILIFPVQRVLSVTDALNLLGMTTVLFTSVCQFELTWCVTCPEQDWAVFNRKQTWATVMCNLQV